MKNCCKVKNRGNGIYETGVDRKCISMNFFVALP